MTITNVVNRLGGQAAVGRPVTSQRELLALAEHGLAKATIRGFARRAYLDEREVVSFLPTTARNLQRYRDQDLLTHTVSDHLIALATLFEHGAAVLGEENFGRWLRLPLATLQGDAPISLLKTHLGIGTVRTELGRIAHGIAV